MLSTKSLAAILQALRSHMRTALQLTSLLTLLQRCMRIMQMVDAALHRVCECISAVLQQQKTNATKEKKKYTRNVCQVQGQLQRRRRCRSHFWRSRWLYDCLPAWLRLCLCLRMHCTSSAALPSSHSHSLTRWLCALPLYMPVCVCACAFACVCYAHLIFNLLLYPNFIWRPISQSPSPSQSLCLLSVQIQVQGAAEAKALYCHLTHTMQLAFSDDLLC